MTGKIVMSEQPQTKRVVVVGNGMVGWKFCDRLTSHDDDGRYELLVFGEEPRPAYDRVQLTSYFDHRSVEELSMAPRAWYTERSIDLRTSERVASVDPSSKELKTTGGETFRYDILVLATGSSPFVPPIDGVDKRGVFVYRTIEDLEGILERAESQGGCCAVLGGGLLGLEAARAVQGCGLDTHVVELAPRLMPRQLDDSGGRLLRQEIEKLGVNVHLGRCTARIVGDEHASGLVFDDDGAMDVDMVVVSAGIRPRDELARAAGIEVGPRGGIVVDDHLATSAPDVYAIGEVALHGDKIYGLVAPGYDMAEVLAKRLTDQHAVFESGDLSAKLKLMGVDVASFGDPFADENPRNKTIEYQDLVKGVYKKLILDDEGRRLLGGMLVGDASEYGQLLHYARSGDPLPDEPESLIVGVRGESAAGGIAALQDGAQICSCNNVSKGDICTRIREDGLTTVAEIKSCTTAGTGCGGCVPMVNDLLDVELAAQGVSVRRRLCEHFDYTRQELFDLIRLKQIKTFDVLIAEHGEGQGCEICKPTAASCFASLFNAMILDDHTTLQDTNDRFLANIQRRGLYSVIPRVPGGEITPDKLIRLGEIAKKYDLYTKITGGQRIDLLGAKLNQLPDVWEDLVTAGFESGHAYAKGIRTVKSCVGSTWCRYGVDDSIGLSIRIEERYRGIRSPHKLKSAVSGCVRECAEAQSKDFGIIATENGWNLYVCGNGGAKPRHADLLASDLDEETLIRYIDRFLIYYIRTADKLTRTSTWVEKIEGGIDHVRDVVVNDSLGLAEELERDMQYLVDTYQCEWAAVVKDPEQRRKFRHFANDDSDDDTVFRIEQRGQRRPADWEKRPAPSAEAIKLELPVLKTEWVLAGRVDDFPVDGGMSIKHGRTQVAVFHFSSRGEWYAVQNMCPHMQDMVLARGILGDKSGEPKVACPLHKKNFSLKTGECLTGENYRVHTFPVRVEDGQVYVELPPAAELEHHLCPQSPGDCVEAAQ